MTCTSARPILVSYWTLNPALIETGCWAHVFRKFRDALKESPVEASRMMRRIAKLFDVEKEAGKNELAPEAVRALRLERSQTVLAEIEKDVEALRGSGSDQGSLAKALTYLENQWPTLVRFLEDGRVPIHNNGASGFRVGNPSQAPGRQVVVDGPRATQGPPETRRHYRSQRA